MDTGETNGGKPDQHAGVPGEQPPPVGSVNVPRRLYFPPLKSIPKPKPKTPKPLQESEIKLPTEGVGNYWIVAKKGFLEKCRYTADKYYCPVCGDWQIGQPAQHFLGMRIQVTCCNCKHVIDYRKKRDK